MGEKVVRVLGGVGATLSVVLLVTGFVKGEVIAILMGVAMLCSSLAQLSLKDPVCEREHVKPGPLDSELVKRWDVQ